MTSPLRLTGPDAGVMKYDLLTAISVAGLHGSTTMQTSMMRLTAAVTARYNWRADELTVGQRDLARMWSVNERTVKREIKRLLEGDVLICKRAGVRGRVAAYQLNYAQIAKISEPCWGLVGPDFDARMRARHAAVPTASVVKLSDYAGETRMHSGATPSGPLAWQRAMQSLCAQNPDQFRAWFAPLTHVNCAHGVLHLRAPSRFAQRYIETHLMRDLATALEDAFGPLERIEFVQ